MICPECKKGILEEANFDIELAECPECGSSFKPLA